MDKKGLLPAEKSAFEIGIPIIVEHDDRAFIEMVKHPKHGTGKGVNPCRDCRIFIFRKAARMVERIGADFIITGEVVGQRPMSQLKNSIDLVERESGLKRKILRPLCAKRLPPSLPETEGWIDREILFGFYGRNRKPQIALAEKFGISDYQSPAGGCALTQSAFAARFEDLISHNPDAGALEIRALEFGRHYRLPGGLKLIIARDEAESIWLAKNLAGKYRLLETSDLPGPMAALDREPSEMELIAAGSLVASYGKARRLSEVEMTLTTLSGEEKRFTVAPADRSVFRENLIV